MSQRTPGSWAVRNMAMPDIRIGPRYDGSAPSIAVVPTSVSRSLEERKANARLIAAAPTLLKALKAMLHEAQQNAPADFKPARGSAMHQAIVSIDIAEGSP